MSVVQIGLFLLFIPIILFLLLYIWLYLKRTYRSERLIGISAPNVSILFLKGAFILSIIVLVLTVLFFVIELLGNR